MNKIDLDKRVAVITGGCSGIGIATAERMVASGATVLLWDVDKDALPAAAEKVGAAGTYHVDVSDLASVSEAAQRSLSDAGKVDILVNSAGISGRMSSVEDYPPDAWRRIIDINLTGTFLCCQALVGHMKNRNYGRIVNVSSTGGKDGNPFVAPYSASKAGVISLTKSLAKELVKTEIRVNCVTPAAIDTDLYKGLDEERRRSALAKIPLGRPGRADEVAALIAWMASEECSFSTGAAFDISGGRSTY